MTAMSDPNGPADPSPALGGLDGLDFGSLLGAASQMMQAQAAAAETEVVGSAGGGAGMCCTRVTLPTAS